MIKNLARQSAAHLSLPFAGVAGLVVTSTRFLCGWILSSLKTGSMKFTSWQTKNRGKRIFMLADLFTQTGAVFSPCKTYRYRLWRTWDASKKPIVFLMLNPSIADENQNDPTVERCQRRAMSMGFGGLQVVNVFGLVSTDPQGLYTCDDPVGPENNEAIREAVKDAGMVVCAWGTHGEHVNRAREVVELLKAAGVSPQCLGQNADGSPKHPLYVSYAVSPMAFDLF